MDAPESPPVGPADRLTPAVFLATGLGVSRGVPAPGTVGALWGVPLWLAIQQLPGHGWQVAAIATLVALGVPVCTRAARDLGGVKDPQQVTWDEFATVPIVYACAPAASTGAAGTAAAWLVAGFALHRVFDITKPWPCRRLERLPEGWGVMMDDVAAALYAGGCYALAWNWFSNG